MLTFLLFAGSILAQEPIEDTTKANQLDVRQAIYNTNGKPFSKSYNRSRTPKIIVDTVRFGGQYASIKLQTAFRSGNHAVSGTSNNTVYVTVSPILTDSSDALYFYGATVVDKGTRIVIKSSNANDSSLVVILAVIK